MKLTLFIAIIIFLRYLVPRLVDFGAPEKSRRKTEWEYRVSFAKLNQELYENADRQKKEELIYYYTHKIRQTDHYGTSSFAHMPKPLQVAYLINELVMEVNNGGYLQFFTNSTGRYTEETLEALRAIGATYNHELLLKAVQLLRKHGETHENLNERINSEELHKIMMTSDFYANEELMKEMYELDKKFYAYKEDISTLKMDYIEKHKNSLWKELEEKYSS
ncbi:DMP19 family protein [Flagellimonas beolgyonensis]|uniref:DMP19 family protein n=1 Tax=Flagellimonas beolgyonensis TaxID=864064 RepID=UPI003D652F50